MAGKYLEMKNISKSFPGVKALSDVSIEADEGEIVALLGENGAGKSTLMNVLGGIIKKDEGSIRIGGKEVEIGSVANATKEGISFIHQELSLFSQLSIEDNMFIEKFPKKKGSPFIDRERIKKSASEILKSLGVDISPTTKVGKLPVSIQQIVEIGIVIYKESKIIIFDEPTTSLAISEREILYRIIRKLRDKKHVILYITHDLDDVLTLCDRMYVLRDGQNAGTAASKDVTKGDIIRMMIGDKAGKQFFKSPKELKSKELVMELKNIHTEGKLKGVNLQLRKGEILGLYGLVGSGRTELMRAFFGVDPMESGEIIVKGNRINKPTPKKIIDEGFAFLTENRRDEGLFLDKGLDFNISITDLSRIQAGALKALNGRKESDLADKVIKMFSVATPGRTQLAGKLSGGNQQKVVIGKWMSLAPEVFIMDEPTKGIDVGAKSEIYRLIDEISREGVSVILISSEIEEILGISDRVIVMANGTDVADLTGEDITKEKIIQYTMSSGKETSE